MKQGTDKLITATSAAAERLAGQLRWHPRYVHSAVRNWSALPFVARVYQIINDTRVRSRVVVPLQHHLTPKITRALMIIIDQTTDHTANLPFAPNLRPLLARLVGCLNCVTKPNVNYRTSQLRCFHGRRTRDLVYAHHSNDCSSPTHQKGIKELRHLLSRPQRIHR